MCKTALPRPALLQDTGLYQLPPHNPFDLNRGFVLAGLRQVVGHLQPKPCFRATAERLVETDRHLRRNTGLAVYKVVERCRVTPRISAASVIVKPQGSMQ